MIVLIMTVEQSNQFAFITVVSHRGSDLTINKAAGEL